MSDPHLLLSGYALDALDPADRATFEAHLVDCEDCRRELAELRPAVTDLSAMTAATPPPQLRANVLSAISQVRQQEPEADRGPSSAGLDHRDRSADVVAMDRRSTRRRGGVARAAAAVIGAAALVAAIALAGWSYGRAQLGREYRAESASVSRIVGAPDARTYRQQTPNGMRVTYVVSQQRNAGMVIVDDEPNPGSGHVYQLWTVRTPGGKASFTPDRTFTRPTGPIIFSGNVSSAAAVGITVEPSGGSRQPTTDPFAVQRLAS